MPRLMVQSETAASMLLRRMLAMARLAKITALESSRAIARE